MKNRNIVLLIVMLLLTIGMVTLVVVVGIVRKNSGNKPIDTKPPTEESTEPIEKSPDPVIPGYAEESTDILPLNPTEPQPENPEVEKPDIDVGEMTRNPEPEVGGGDIEYGTKEAETNAE